MIWKAVVVLSCALLAFTSTTRSSASEQGRERATASEAREIAKEAFIYGYPLVDNYRILHSYFVNPKSPEYKAPWNVLHNESRVYTPADKALQTPNSDTPYSQLGTDLRAQPLVISVPKVEGNRYYSLQFIDAYTFNYEYVGSRSTGNDAGVYLLAGPKWDGQVPEGITKVIRSETEFGWVLYRTQLLNADDLENVKAVQAGYKVELLSDYVGTPAPEARETEFIVPLKAEEQRVSPKFFSILDFVLKFCPTHPSEREMMARFAKIGISGQGNFNADDLDEEMKSAIVAGMADDWKAFEIHKKTEVDTGNKGSADSFGTREFLAGDYLGRMAGAILGIYGNSQAEALYPTFFTDSQGQPLTGESNRYALRFAPGQLPPVNAFWSLTMYSFPESLLVENPINRYLINSPMLDSLKKDADGGLTLYIQYDAPGGDKDSNWLPAPAGGFWAVLRLYWPKDEAINGKWKAPKMIKAGETTGESTSVEGLVPVTADNFPRAETDLYLGATIATYDNLGRFSHNRDVTPIDGQTVIRMNRDTLYSALVLDLDAGPATVTLPDPGDRFLSMQVINQDHYTPMVNYGAGRYVLNKENVGTRHAIIAIRTLVNPSIPGDLEKVHALQDQFQVEQASPGVFEAPRWDPVSQKRVRDALLVLSDTLPDKGNMFGKKGEVDPVRHLLGSASAWGGNPDKDAVYLNVVPAENDGKTPYVLTVKDVPVDSFWSISVYNAEGYFERNEHDIYTLNNLVAKKNDDGSVTIHFGGDKKEGENFLPICNGWNYLVRLYRPRQEILDGSYEFPAPKRVGN